VHDHRLEREVLSFEDLIKAYEKLDKIAERAFKGGSRMAHNLCELYAMISAFRIRACIGVSDEIAVRAALLETDHNLSTQGWLPQYDSVQKAGQALLIAATQDDKAKMSSALEEMGVLALCPILEEQFPRMELVTEKVSGRARLVPILNLVLFAAEVGDYEKASRYALRSRAFDPSSWELYALCIVEGLIALNAGDTREAIQCLEKSINACLTDEYSALHCSVRAPILTLAEKLLQNGERVEVLRHLLQCQDVWQFLGPRFAEWAGVIESGQQPQFHTDKTLEAMNQPSANLGLQWMTACSIEKEPDSYSPKKSIAKSPSAINAGRERLREEYRRYKASKGEGGVGEDE